MKRLIHFLISSGSVDDIPYGLQLDCLSHFISVSYHVTLMNTANECERFSSVCLISSVLGYENFEKLLAGAHWMVGLLLKKDIIRIRPSLAVSNYKNMLN